MAVRLSSRDCEARFVVSDANYGKLKQALEESDFGIAYDGGNVSETDNDDGTKTVELRDGSWGGWTSWDYVDEAKRIVGLCEMGTVFQVCNEDESQIDCFIRTTRGVDLDTFEAPGV